MIPFVSLRQVLCDLLNIAGERHAEMRTVNQSTHWIAITSNRYSFCLFLYEHNN